MSKVNSPLAVQKLILKKKNPITPAEWKILLEFSSYTNFNQDLEMVKHNLSSAISENSQSFRTRNELKSILGKISNLVDEDIKTLQRLLRSRPEF